MSLLKKLMNRCTVDNLLKKGYSLDDIINEKVKVIDMNESIKGCCVGNICLPKLDVNEVSKYKIGEKLKLDAVDLNELIEKAFYDNEEFVEEYESNFSDDYDNDVRDKIEYNNLSEEDAEKKVKEELSEKLEEEVEHFKDFESVFPVYRMITLKDLNDLSCDEIGVFWSWDEKRAEAHLGGGKGQIFKILITGLVDKGNVNWKTTLLMNINPYFGEEETEIRLKENVPVLITDIKLISMEREHVGKKHPLLFKEELPMKCNSGKEFMASYKRLG